MPLSKIQLKAGVNKEGTRYSTEGGWNDSDKVRFRKGLPEKIGGWHRISETNFLGIARSIHTWRTLASKLYIGIGTHLKFYVEAGGAYNDITPLRKATATLAANPLITFATSTTVRVIDTTGGYRDGDFVTFAGTVTTTNGVETADLQNKEFQISYNTSQQASTTIDVRVNNSTTVTLDAPSDGTIAIGMTMTGTDESGSAISELVTAVGSQTSITIANAKTIADGAAVAFAHTDSYTITIASASGGSPASSPAGGSSITATYQINTGSEIETAEEGWGGGAWSGGTWSNGLTTESNIRIWSQANFGQDLIISARGNPLFYWFGDNALTTRAVDLDNKDTITATKNGDSGGATTTLAINTPSVRSGSNALIRVGMIVGGTGESGVIRVATVTSQTALITDNTTNISNTTALTFKNDVPAKANRVLVSDVNRFVFCFGTTAYLDDTHTMDPLLVRWSDQEDATQWVPSQTNQAGSLRLSRGGEIITAIQARQEVLVWTDAALYAMQYVGYPDVWTAQIVGENTSIASPNAAAYANGISFWMGQDKFYSYDGNVKPLPCSLHRHVFNDINTNQAQQVVAGTNEEYNEVWWFYPADGSTENNRYVIYNYLENIWYHGKDIKRTAWEDSGIRDYPIAATSNKNIVNHEFGVDDAETSSASPIVSSITSSEFDLQDGHNFAFVWRLLPDITFDGSTSGAPSATLTINPLDSSGSGYNDPVSEGGVNTGTVTRTQKPTTTVVEAFTTQINTRLRGRQMSFKIESDTLGVKWQLGYPRIDMRPDGRR
jgi:hypothetical protein